MLAVSTDVSYAMCGVCEVGDKPQAAKAAKVDEAKLAPINDVCPVMGGPIAKDTKHYAIVNGEKVGFCGAECVKEFDKDPKKYMGKANAEKK